MPKPLIGINFEKIAAGFRSAMPSIQKTFAAFQQISKTPRGEDPNNTIPLRPWSADPEWQRGLELFRAITPSTQEALVGIQKLAEVGMVGTGYLQQTPFNRPTHFNCRCITSFNPSDRPKACQGCQNYHGETYNGNRLICGIYPYGWNDGDECPDRAEAN